MHYYIITLENIYYYILTYNGIEKYLITSNNLFFSKARTNA